MATLISKCPHCGAQIIFDEDSKAVVCQYCSSVIAVENRNKHFNTKNASSGFVLRELFPEFQFKGWYYNEPEAPTQRGTLCISENELYFKPNKFTNLLDDYSDKIIALSDICGYQRYDNPSARIADAGIIFYIKEDGEIKEKRFEISGTKPDRDNLLNNIEYYRKKYYLKNHQEIPALMEDSIQVPGNGLIDMRFSMNHIMTYGMKYFFILLFIAIALLFIISAIFG